MAIWCKIKFPLLIVVFALLRSATAVSLSFNQPTFCPNATWNPNGTLFANASTNPHAIFVHINNDTVYVTEQDSNRVQVWSNKGGIPMRTISNNLDNPGAIFVTTNGNIYVDSGDNDRVELWTWNATIGVAVMSVSVQCMGLFIDINNTLYCSASDNAQVIAKSLNGNGNPTTVVAGSDSAGPGSDQLCDPNGIFVDVNFNLYVADWCNERIQKFAHGQLNGTTVAGDEAPGTIHLNGPTAVILDGNGYLFIVDAENNRIVASGPNGFRCLAGCSGIAGAALNQLNSPVSVGFDTYGNLFVSDGNNNRIVKFILATNSCGQISTSQPIPTTVKTSQPMTMAASANTTSTSAVQITAVSTSRHMSSSSTLTKLSVLYLYMLLCMIIVH